MTGIIVLWLLWCLLHSALIARTVTGRIDRLPPPWPGAYKLAYNAFSLVTLLPLAWISHSSSQKPIVLPLWFTLLQALLLVYALLLFAGGLVSTAWPTFPAGASGSATGEGKPR